MDEKLQKELLEIYDSLSDEQKEKVKECKTMEEVSTFAAEEGIELPDEILDDVAGGYVYNNGRNYEVIDDNTGGVVDNVYGSEIDAQNRAKELNQRPDVISWLNVEHIRKTYKQSLKKPEKKKGC